MKQKMKKKTIVWIILGVFLAFLFVSCVVPPLLPGRGGTAPKLAEAADVGERVRCVDDNQDALLWRLKLIEEAKENLILVTFNWTDDESGRDIMSALQNAAARGVNVRVVVDGMSGLLNLKMSKNFRALAATDGVEVRIYNPIHLWEPWKANYRMHDKYVIVDDNLYLLGGRNTKNLSLGDYQEKKDIDRDVLVYSPQNDPRSSLNQVKTYFESIWSQKNTKPYRPMFAAKQGDHQRLKDNYETLKTRYPEVFHPTDWEQVTMPTGGIQLLCNPNHVGTKQPELWNNLMKLMADADDRLIQTPYLICSREMYEDLYGVCAEGGKTSILLNSVESGANTFGSVDYLNQKENIRQIGVDLYEFINKDSSHAKTLLLDDDTCVIGSFNCDSRSAYLDTELMLVIKCPQLNSDLRQLLSESMESSRYVQPTSIAGTEIERPLLSFGKWLLFSVLRIIEPPFRHLL